MSSAAVAAAIEQKRLNVPKLFTSDRSFILSAGYQGTYRLLAEAGRVSTIWQNPYAQYDAVTAEGCTKVFTDHFSGTLAHRPALTQPLDYLRPGRHPGGHQAGPPESVGEEPQGHRRAAGRRRGGLAGDLPGTDTTTSGGRLFFHIWPPGPTSSTTQW